MPPAGSAHIYRVLSALHARPRLHAAHHQAAIRRRTAARVARLCGVCSRQRLVFSRPLSLVVSVHSSTRIRTGHSRVSTRHVPSLSTAPGTTRVIDLLMQRWTPSLSCLRPPRPRHAHPPRATQGLLGAEFWFPAPPPHPNAPNPAPPAFTPRSTRPGSPWCRRGRSRPNCLRRPPYPAR